MRTHLRGHNVDTPKKKHTQPELNFAVMPKLTVQEKWAVAFAVNGWSFHSADTTPYVAELAPTMPCRQTLSKISEQTMAKLKAAALGKMTNVTLCYDSGTVHKRYLVFVAATANAAVTFKMVADTSFEDGTFSGENIREAVTAAIAECLSYGCVVVETVADNASNMQMSARARCAAHVLQLAMGQAMETPLVKKGMEVLANIETRHKLPRCPETRWSYMLRKLDAALPLAEGADAQHAIAKACEVLRPFDIATNMVQGDNATLFSSCFAWQELLASADPTVKPIVQKRFEYLLRDSYLLIAYFAPTVDNVKQGATLDPLVKAALAQYDDGASAEMDSYSRSVRRHRVGATLSKAEYESYLETVIKSRWPRTAMIVAGLLNATPTEAAVERALSQLKFIVDDWRNKLDEATAANLLIIKSTHMYLAELAKGFVTGKTSQPQKKIRPDGQSASTAGHSASPTPRTPSQDHRAPNMLDPFDPKNYPVEVDDEECEAVLLI